jgi:peptidoglycan-associated lipoprotein
MKLKFPLLKIALSLVVVLTLASCGSTAKKPNTTPEPVINKVDVDNGKNNGINLELNGDSDSNKAGGLVTVYFDFNSAALRSDTKEALDKNVTFLKANTAVKVQVEGHCDERGSVQFNLALGEKRAKSVREYLTAQGIEASRVTTISFGKERPVTFGHDEEAWSKNRRANFVIVGK